MAYSYDRTAGKFPPGWVSLNPISKVLKEPQNWIVDLARTEDGRFLIQAYKRISGQRSYRESTIQVYVLEYDPVTKASRDFVRLPNKLRGKKPEEIAAWLNQQVEQGVELTHSPHEQ